MLLENLEDDNGMVILSKQKADIQRNWTAVTDNCEEGQVVEGKVISRVKGGMIVDVMGIDAILTRLSN